MSTKVISIDNATVVIQVKPHAEQDKIVINDEQEAGGTYHNTALKGFLKVHPKILGIFQIIAGVLVFILGIAVTISIGQPIRSGITYWGSLIYISAGALSVAAVNKLHPCVVKASLGMNVFSAITAGISILLMSMDLAIVHFYAYSSVHYFYMGIIVVMILISIPQFIISICISGFACKATCTGAPSDQC